MKGSAWSPLAIKTLRGMTGESTAAFGARLGRSGRTIEDWEQGRHRPDGLACKALAARARRVLAARARKTARAGEGAAS